MVKKTPFFLYSQSNINVGGDDLDVIKEIFGEDNVSELITDIKPDHIVIPRFRSIPFGKELEKDVKALGSELINTYYQHRSIADLRNWAYLLEDLTAPAFSLEDIPSLPEGEYFVKGETNSIKKNWFSSAYAADKKSLITVVGNVLNDQYVGTQSIVIRPFRKFRQIDTAVNGQPVFNERRVFIMDGKVISEAFYWSGFNDPSPLDRDKFDTCLNEAIEKTSHLSRFYVIDLAEYPDGSWEVIELNDGPMSGLSENSCRKVWEGVLNSL